MTLPVYDVALLTDRRYTAKVASEGDWYLENILSDDGLLQEALLKAGLTSVRLDWAKHDVYWPGFRCVVFRSTWDYYDRFSEFSQWLGRVQTRTNLCNPASLVWWNLDKHYLADLKERGLPVVDSSFIEKGTVTPLPDLLAESGWPDAIIKPCISGAARHTYRINPSNVLEVAPVIEQLLASESFILQPFQQDIVEQGEDTLMVINGRFTHAVRKVPKEGDFRVQDDHGGTVHKHIPAPDQIELAERVMASCTPTPAYGRVDMVRDNNGRLAIMELELIEPELWLRFHPPAATEFANAIALRVR